MRKNLCFRALLHPLHRPAFQVVSVLRVDVEKGYIDLSKKRVNAEDAAIFEEECALGVGLRGRRSVGDSYIRSNLRR